MSIKSIEISNLSSFDKFNFDITKDGNVNKNVLIFDDLYRSGDTLSAISKRLLNKGKVNTVKVLCITKTRTKR